jgi:hypothetical protein
MPVRLVLFRGLPEDRLEESTQTNLQASQHGPWRHAGTIRSYTHTRRSISLKERFESLEHRLDEDIKRFFKLFEESTFEGSQAVAQNMKKYAKEPTENFQKFLLIHSLHFLARFPNTKMLSWPNSPLLVLLQFVNPNVLSGDDLANLTVPNDYSAHGNQLILAKQRIEHGANVNAASIPDNKTPLHSACYHCNVTNLDFVELLLREGADPNIQDHLGLPPLMCTVPYAPGAAKFLLNWPTTDVNFTTQSGDSFLAWVRSDITVCSNETALPDNPDQVQQQFLLQQLREIE